jgi:hypothetical protein
MCPKVKRYKGKEMSTIVGTEKRQKTCLEGDTDSEEKVKKLLETSRRQGPYSDSGESTSQGEISTVVVAARA